MKNSFTTDTSVSSRISLNYKCGELAGDLAVGEGSELDDKTRFELIRRVNAGEHVELSIQAQTYAQGPTVTNRRYTRFTREALDELSNQMVSERTPFQWDHSLASEDQGGYVLASEVRESEGVESLLNTIRINTPRAVTSALNGNLNKFSISWTSAPDSLSCSACNAPIADCTHYPGDLIEDTNDRVYLIYNSAEPIEVSAVTFPAVKSTGVESISDRLSAIRQESKYVVLVSGENTRMDNEKLICEALGLGDKAATADIVGCAVSLKADVTDLRVQLEARETEADELRETVAKLTADMAAKEKVALTAECDALCTELVTDGRVRKGDARESMIRKLFAGGNEDMAREIAKTYCEGPRLVPTGRQSHESVELASDTPGHTIEMKEGTPDWNAMFDALGADTKAACSNFASNPEQLFRANPDLALKLGVNLTEKK